MRHPEEGFLGRLRERALRTWIAEESVVFDGAYIGSFPIMPARAEVMAGRHVWLGAAFGWSDHGPGDAEASPPIVRGHQSDPFHATDHVELRWPCSPEKCRQPEELVVPYLILGASEEDRHA